MAASMTIYFFFLLPGHYAPFAIANLLHRTVTLDTIDTDRYYTYGDTVDKIIYGRLLAICIVTKTLLPLL